MERKVMIKLFIFIIVIAVLSYSFGFNSSAKKDAEIENKYKDLFLLDPFGNQFTIVQTFTGVLRSAENNSLTVEVDGENKVVYIRQLNMTYIYNCKGIIDIEPSAEKCTFMQLASLKKLIDSGVRIRASRSLADANYFVGTISY